MKRDAITKSWGSEVGSQDSGRGAGVPTQEGENQCLWNGVGTVPAPSPNRKEKGMENLEIIEVLGVLIVVVCLFTVIANILLLWSVQKLYTEYFKDRSISHRKEKG